MGLKFAIMYEGEKGGKKIIKPMMIWPEKQVLLCLKKHFEVTHDFDKAFNAAVAEFKKESIKIP